MLALSATHLVARPAANIGEDDHPHHPGRRVEHGGLWASVTGMDGYQALLLVSFGGPERSEDVMPFLRRVTAGRGIPEDRIAAVAEHYYAAGGASPINSQCRALLSALRSEMADLPLRLYWGNRNWPQCSKTLWPRCATMA